MTIKTHPQGKFSRSMSALAESNLHDTRGDYPVPIHQSAFSSMRSLCDSRSPAPGGAAGALSPTPGSTRNNAVLHKVRARRNSMESIPMEVQGGRRNSATTRTAAAGRSRRSLDMPSEGVVLPPLTSDQNVAGAPNRRLTYRRSLTGISKEMAMSSAGMPTRAAVQTSEAHETQGGIDSFNAVNLGQSTGGVHPESAVEFNAAIQSKPAAIGGPAASPSFITQSRRRLQPLSSSGVLPDAKALGSGNSSTDAFSTSSPRLITRPPESFMSPPLPIGKALSMPTSRRASSMPSPESCLLQQSFGTSPPLQPLFLQSIGTRSDVDQKNNLPDSSPPNHASHARILRSKSCVGDMPEDHVPIRKPRRSVTFITVDTGLVSDAKNVDFGSSNPLSLPSRRSSIEIRRNSIESAGVEDPRQALAELEDAFKGLFDHGHIEKDAWELQADRMAEEEAEQQRRKAIEEEHAMMEKHRRQMEDMRRQREVVEQMKKAKKAGSINQVVDRILGKMMNWKKHATQNIGQQQLDEDIDSRTKDVEMERRLEAVFVSYAVYGCWNPSEAAMWLPQDCKGISNSKFQDLARDAKLINQKVGPQEVRDVFCKLNNAETGFLEFPNFLIAVSQLGELDRKEPHHGIVSVLKLNKEGHMLIHDASDVSATAAV